MHSVSVARAWRVMAGACLQRQHGHRQQQQQQRRTQPTAAALTSATAAALASGLALGHAQEGPWLRQ